MSYQCLKLNGSGFCSIPDASAAGLDMGLSDFMLEVRVRTVTTGSSQRIISKREGLVGYEVFLDVTGKIYFFIGDSGGYMQVASTNTAYGDNRWHDIAVAIDRSGNVYFFKDGVADGSASISSYNGSIDNSSAFCVGTFSVTPGTLNLTGLTDELRIWNFGYGGLPADYADYIAWRAAGRNVFKDISEYNSGAWNCYADADRTEKVTDGGLENWTTDTNLTSWTEEGVSAGVRDITKESTEKHGGSYAAKFESTLDNGTSYHIDQDRTLVANKYYELLAWIYHASRTAGIAKTTSYNSTDGEMLAIGPFDSIDAAYTQYAGVFKPTVVGSTVYCYHYSETTTGIAYFDDISLKRVGLVAHWKLDGDYTDETTNSNDLTAGGTGNIFPGYTLKKHKIISPASVW